MRMILSFIIGLTLFSTTVTAQDKKSEPKIRKYWFVLLVRGSNTTQDSATGAKIQAGHMANMEKMYNDGKLKVAGPFGDNSDWRGIFIFDCENKEEVEELLKTDPAIAAGRLAYQIKPWYTMPTGNFAPGKPVKQ